MDYWTSLNRWVVVDQIKSIVSVNLTNIYKPVSVNGSKKEMNSVSDIKRF